MANQRELIKEGGLTVVGRYMNGNEVVGYHLNGNGMQGGRVSKEQLYSLIQKGAIENCTAQVYNGKVLFRGKDGMKLSDLPVFDEKSGTYKNVNSDIRGKRADGNLGKYIVVERLMNGNDLCAVAVKDSVGTKRIISIDIYNKLLENGSILNVKTQKNNGETLYRYDKKYEVKTRKMSECLDYLMNINIPIVADLMRNLGRTTKGRVSGTDIYDNMVSGGNKDRLEKSLNNSLMARLALLSNYGTNVVDSNTHNGVHSAEIEGLPDKLVAGYLISMGTSNANISKLMEITRAIEKGLMLAQSMNR